MLHVKCLINSDITHMHINKKVKQIIDELYFRNLQFPEINFTEGDL